jgi:pilus assembly protein CpaB
MARIQELTLNRGNRLLFLVALIAGAIAAALVFVALSEDDDAGTASTATGGGRTVVVAAQDIAPGTTITDGMLKLVQVPEDLVVAGAFEDASLVAGQKARVRILAGEQVASAKIGVQEEDEEGLSRVIQDGSRGIAVSIEQVTAVGGLLRPGDRVDVFAAFREEETDRITVRPLLRDIEVLAVAQTAQEPVPVPQEGEPVQDLPTSGQVPEDADENPDASTVTLSVTPEQARAIVCGQEAGINVWLALRPFGEAPATEQPPLPPECNFP